MKAKYIYFPPSGMSVDVKTTLETTIKKGIRTGLIELNVNDRKLRIWIVDKWKDIGILLGSDIKKIMKINKFSDK